MPCTHLTDGHFCAMALIKDGKRTAVWNPAAAALFLDLAAAKMVKWDESERPIDHATMALGYGWATLLPDGVGALGDYRALGADV